ncbi:MAG TPA: OadG family protein [Anaerolineales bacterium]|nr:OadG family protein [Anaerolineales bacterium]HNB36133.1 OadG family protein [Anaerolineales bacterium]HNC07575.1 OadG family protein [Anaerolineales bacterium]
MTTDLQLSLQITALGMGLVFGAILLLWLMMVILTALTRDKEPASDSAEPVSSTQTDSKLQVALLAVAMAMAEQEASSAHPLPTPPTAIVSAWQLGMRTSQRSEKGNFRRH